jgi:hypothetical protein
MRLGYLEGPFEHGSRSVKIVNSVLGVPKKDAPDKPRMCVNLTGSKVNEKLEFVKFLCISFCVASTKENRECLSLTISDQR